jgi:hypothetical protein
MEGARQRGEGGEGGGVQGGRKGMFFPPLLGTRCWGSTRLRNNFIFYFFCLDGTARLLVPLFLVCVCVCVCKLSLSLCLSLSVSRTHMHRPCWYECVVVEVKNGKWVIGTDSQKYSICVPNVFLMCS